MVPRGKADVKCQGNELRDVDGKRMSESLDGSRLSSICITAFLKKKLPVLDVQIL